jgi:hypothetical protein
MAIKRRMHRRQHLRMLAHAEIVVRAPHRHLARSPGIVPDRPRIAPGLALDIGKDAVAALLAEGVEPASEKGLVVHA